MSHPTAFTGVHGASESFLAGGAADCLAAVGAALAPSARGAKLLFDMFKSKINVEVSNDDNF